MAREEQEGTESAGLTWCLEQLLRSCWADWLEAIRGLHPAFQAAVKLEGCKLGHRRNKPEAYPFRAVGMSCEPGLWSEAGDIRYTGPQISSLF